MIDGKILIIGFSGAGKSYLLEQLKQRGVSGDDLDQVVIEETKFNTTREMIIDIGIDEFRAQESLALREWLHSSSNQYLALGGGSLTKDHIGLINQLPNIKCIYIDRDFTKCWEGLNQRGSSYLIELGQNEAKKLFDKRKKEFSQLKSLEIYNHADEYLNRQH